MIPVKLCSRCGHVMVETVYMNERAFMCVNCFHIDFDLPYNFIIREDTKTYPIDKEDIYG